jgi:gliding motility-associated-like protein
VCTNAAKIIDTIAVGQKKTFILDQSELIGQGVSIYDITPVKNINIAVFNANQSVFGVDYSGIGAGTTDAIFIYADELGITDTVYFQITVRKKFKIEELLAVDDEISTKKNNTVYWNILQNDHFTGSLTSLNILSPASHGKTILENNGVVTYLPDKNYCGKDRFSYRICNIDGCDDANVLVDVICKGLVIYNGFSPNGDGNNDYFTIDGIEEFPGNTLTVFNRWGQQVYEAKDYKNNWDGSWNGKTLTDGTYFYILQISDSERYTGYIYLTR